MHFSSAGIIKQKIQAAADIADNYFFIKRIIAAAKRKLMFVFSFKIDDFIIFKQKAASIPQILGYFRPG